MKSSMQGGQDNDLAAQYGAFSDTGACLKTHSKVFQNQSPFSKEISLPCHPRYVPVFYPS